MKVKGYIVATRFKMEDQKKAVSKIFTEDPESPGDSPLVTDSEENSGLRRMIIHNHYSSIFEILGHPLQGAALRLGILLPQEENIVVGVWRCLIPPLDRLRFIGGYLSSEETHHQLGEWWIDPLPLRDWPFISREEMRDIMRRTFWGWNPNLAAAQKTFFGLESSTFKGVLQETRAFAIELSIRANELADVPLPEQISLLRDGTILAPASFMRLEDVIVL